MRRTQEEYEWNSAWDLSSKYDYDSAQFCPFCGGSNLIKSPEFKGEYLCLDDPCRARFSLS